MKGHVFLKVTGILMIIAAAFSIIVGVLLAGISALAAGLGAASGLKFFLLGGAVFDVGRRHLPADCRNQGHQAQ